jgi:SAM-dependent methyltransferase
MLDLPRQPVDHPPEDLVAWLSAARPPAHTIKEVQVYYQTINPRNVFMKSLPLGARLVDFGAGAGQTAALRTWPTFPRPDIRLFGVGLDRADKLSEYEEIFIGNFEQTRPHFRVHEFDGVLCANCLEHLRRFEPVLEWMYNVLVPGGRVFLEWPHEFSKKVTGRARLLELGYDVNTVNFYDDASHVEAWRMTDVVAEAERLGFTVDVSGRINWPYLAEAMRDVGIASKDQTTLTLAIWAREGWSQYVILARPRKPAEDTV